MVEAEYASVQASDVLITCLVHGGSQWKRCHGVNIVDGHVTYPGVAEAFGLDYADVQRFLTPPAQA